MSEKRIDPLALYAGLDLSHPVTGLRGAPIYQRNFLPLQNNRTCGETSATPKNKRKNTLKP